MMPLVKTKGNNYDWITHAHAHLGGECPHKCIYCYVDTPRFGRHPKYQGELRLIEKEFSVNYGSGKVIFIENCNDLFAKEVPMEFIDRILSHCFQYPFNTYVFQTKNPARYSHCLLPVNGIYGTTIETNRDIPGISKAPRPKERMEAMVKLKARKFVTIEPILQFDTHILVDWIAKINPEFVNIGADSKEHGLPEPTMGKIWTLIDRLKIFGIEVREKHNLQRLKGGA
jgi:DNA repair photolyase